MQAGDKYGRLSAVRDAGLRRGRRRWVFMCDCGTEVECDARDVSRGGTKSTKSCGCLWRERARTKRVVHGLGKSAEYHAWQRAKRRCKSHPTYLAAGVKMAVEWLNAPESFIAHIGPRPSPAHTVERINNARGYEPGNIRWATRAEQARNTRRNVWVTFKGQQLTITDACRITGAHPCTALARVRRGIKPEAAICP